MKTREIVTFRVRCRTIHLAAGSSHLADTMILGGHVGSHIGFVTRPMRRQSPPVLLASRVDLASSLLSLRLSLLARKMGIENLSGSVVRINRHCVVSTVGAADSAAQAASTLSSRREPHPCYSAGLVDLLTTIRALHLTSSF